MPLKHLDGKDAVLIDKWSCQNGNKYKYRCDAQFAFTRRFHKQVEWCLEPLGFRFEDRFTSR